MSVKKIRISCGKCKTHFIIPYGEIPLHVANHLGDDVILCPKCCKEKYWFEPERCNQCSEKPLCSGCFLLSFKDNLNEIKGI